MQRPQVGVDLGRGRAGREMQKKVYVYSDVSVMTIPTKHWVVLHPRTSPSRGSLTLPLSGRLWWAERDIADRRLTDVTSG